MSEEKITIIVNQNSDIKDMNMKKTIELNIFLLSLNYLKNCTVFY